VVIENDINDKISEVFSEFDQIPIASASLA